MYSFYGSKSKIAKLYPKPTYPKINDPFCGSARYPLLYWEHEVTISDVDETIIGLWKYLQATTPKRILALPDVENATELATIQGFSQLEQEEKWLIGFCSNGGSATPKNFSGRHNFNSWNRDKIRIARDLHKIKHWKIVHCNYFDVDNEIATWFIDPPYKGKGKWYRYSYVDYARLARWCQSRLGQVIVCENMGADWLPFKHLKDIPFSHFKTEEDKTRKTAEAIYIQN